MAASVYKKRVAADGLYEVLKFNGVKYKKWRRVKTGLTQDEANALIKQSRALKNRKRYTSEQETAAVADWRAGVPLKQLLHKHDVSHPTLYKWLRKTGNFKPRYLTPTRN